MTKLMSKAYKNFRSLNTDEAVVAGILRDETTKDIEIFMPMNAQMKDVDLVARNMKNKKSITIQVKWSRAYEPKISERKNFWDWSAWWFFFSKDIIARSEADYFIFLIYVIEQEDVMGRRAIRPHTLAIPTIDLKEIVKKYKNESDGDRYSFIFWIDPKKKLAWDIRNKKNIYPVSDYLDKKWFEKMNNFLSQ